MDDVLSCRERERGDIILGMSILCGDFFLKLVKPTKHNTLFLIGALCFFVFFFHLFFCFLKRIDDGTLGFGRGLHYNSVGALWSFFTFFSLAVENTLVTRFL